MRNLFRFYISIFVLNCLMNSTRATACSHTNFQPYECQLLPQENRSLKFPCIVQNGMDCQNFKEKTPPKDLRLETVHLVSINLYNITYSLKDKDYPGETYSALNLTFSLPSGDMLASCLAVRVNIWNNCTNSNYGGKGYCRLFNFNLHDALKKTDIQPAYINHKCFTGITAARYFLKFTTLPYITEITYSIIIKHTKQSILAVAPMHHQMAISIILQFPVAKAVCKKKFRLTRFQTATEDIKFSIDNNFLFENLQPGFYRVKVELNCLVTEQTMESDIIQLKDISEAENIFSEKIIWIALSLIPAIILIICLYRYYKWKQKCIDRSHRCVIDLLYSCDSNKDRIIAEHLQKLMEDVFEWSVNSIPVDFFIPDLYGSPMSNVSLYLTAPDTQGKVRVPDPYKNQKINTCENNDLIKILLYYKQKRNNQISVDFQPSFDIVKDIKKLFYFVYSATKSKNPVELFEETYYPKVNTIEKQTFWNGFVYLIENAAELNCGNENEWGIMTQHDSIRLNNGF